MARPGRAFQRGLTLKRHWPFPAYVLDRHWNVVSSNAAVPELYEGVDPALLIRPINVLRLMLHPRAMAPRICNHRTWRSHFIGLLRRQIELTGDPVLEGLLNETLAYPAPDGPPLEVEVGGPAMPLIVETRLGRLSFIGATTVFGSPADVTLQEIALEVMHPADAFTERAVRCATTTSEQTYGVAVR